MPEANLQPDIDALKAANMAITAKQQDDAAKLQAADAKLQAADAKLTVQQQQIDDLKAAIANTATLGK